MTSMPAFETEHFFARYEFTAPHLLAASDCESMTIAELLDRSGGDLTELGRVPLQYTESTGDPALRDQIASAYDGVTADDVIVLNSPIEGIYVTIRAMLGPGDEAIVLVPAFDALKNLPSHVGAIVHRWELSATGDGWELDLDVLQELLSSRTKLVVANFPHNPTGYQPTVDEFSTMLDLIERAGAWLYHDEMFRGLEHGDRPRLPSAAERSERTVVLSGLSKMHGLPGLRAGWLLMRDRALYDEIMNWKMYTSICPPAPVEYLARCALTIAEELAARNQALIRDNLAVADSFFARHRDTFVWRRPMSGPVALVEIDEPSATSYCERLAREAGIVLLPGAFLGVEDRYVRFGFGRTSFPEAVAAYEAHLAS